MDLKETLKPVEPFLPYMVMVVGLASAALFVWYFAAEDDRKKRNAGTFLSLILTGFSIFCVMLGLKLGIDLQGGASFLVRVQPAEGRTVSSDALRGAQEIIEKRLNPEGTRDVTVTPQGTDALYVEVPGLSDAEIRESKGIIEKVAKLEFRLLGPGGLQFLPADDQTVQPGYVKMPYLSSREETATSGGKDGAPKTPPAPDKFVFVKNRAEMSGKSVKNAFPQLPPGALSYSISVNLHSEYGDKMLEITKENLGKPLAIVLDGVVISAPVIQGQFGDHFQITGDYSEKAAREQASQLENPLENPLSVESSNTTSATYGKEVVRQGLMSALFGLLATLAFMMVYYRLSGIIAVVGLIINLLLLLGAMQIFGFTLTMPGIAGIILTLGMAVDANVLIYERLREEFAAGKSFTNAINAAYEKAFSAIFDSNITSLITSVIMIFVASGAIRGFGLSLAIGLLASMFSALIITRVCFLWLSSRGLAKLSFLNLIDNKFYNFMGRRKMWLTLSGVIMAGCLALIAIKGKNSLGYELRGGDSVSLQGIPSLSEKSINDALAEWKLTVDGQDFDHTSLSVQSVKPLGGETYFTVRSAPGTAASILAELKKDLGGTDPALLAKFDTAEISTMGSAVGAAILERSAWALGLGLLGIFIYVTFRFEFPFAVGATVALLHDVIFAVGMCILFDKEIGLILVGAFLTIAGFSINDTIVIFDRVRENLRTMKGDLEDVLNHAISATLSRTIITSGVTSLAVLSMYIFGGKSMADFSFAMLLGMISGTYSTIFIASPVVLWWANKRKLNLRKQILDADAARLEILSGIEREAPVRDSGKNPETGLENTAPNS